MKRKKSSSPKSRSPEKKAAAPSFNISPGRLWLFRILAPIAVLLLLLGGAELVLRLCGYGYPATFFLKTKIGGKEYYVSNLRFGYRFFPPTIARTPEPLRMEVAKPANTYRIFVFGESAAMGDPDPTFGAWRYLQVLLRERFPGTDFQVICTAMTAINSHAILPIARECAQREGDLWIIYMGNNEMVGPFGASSVFGSRVAGINVIRASLALKTTKVGQLLDSLRQRWAHSSAPGIWGGLNMFKNNQLRYDDPNRLRVYENFRQNLGDMLRAGQEAGVPVILSAVGSNLKDCAPFGSLHSPGLGDKSLAACNRLYQAGTNLEASGNFAEAIKSYQQAAAIDSQYAELHFREGRCLLALTNDEASLHELTLARDDDTLAFRADSRINQIIQDAAAENANHGVYFLDAPNTFAQRSPEKIPGNELFYEHVHLNFEGNYLLGRAFAEQALKLLPKSILVHARTEWASEELCDRRLGVSPWDRFRVWQENFSRVSEPPFTGQLNDAARARFYMAKLRELHAQMTDQTRTQSRAAYEESLALNPDDACLRENFAQFLDETGDLPEAPAQEQRVADMLPQNPVTPCIIGRLFVRLGKDDQAEKSFLRALAIRSDDVAALNEMGILRANQQKTAEAATYFARSLKIDPNSVEAHQALGFMEQTEGNLDQALVHYQAAAKYQPNGPGDYFYRAMNLVAEHRGAEAFNYFSATVYMEPAFWQARFSFGLELAAEGKIDQAQAQFSQVVVTRPDFAPGHLQNGIALAKLGKLDDALVEFQNALRLNPSDEDAQKNLQAVQRQLPRHQ